MYTNICIYDITADLSWFCTMCYYNTYTRSGPWNICSTEKQSC